MIVDGFVCIGSCKGDFGHLTRRTVEEHCQNRRCSGWIAPGKRWSSSPRQLGIPTRDAVPCVTLACRQHCPYESSSSHYPRCFLTFGRFSECCGFFTFGVSIPNLRPFSESLISVASRR